MGATNVNEALDKNRGISVQVECSICNVRNVLLNNLPGRYTTLMIDGVPIFSSVSSAYGLNSVSVYGVERIDVARARGPACGPCITELPRLEAFAKANPQWTVLLVSTDAPSDAREFVLHHGVRLAVLRPGANVAALMRSAGNRSGGLPFTVALKADSQAARICAGQPGELAPADLERIAIACEAKARP